MNTVIRSVLSEASRCPIRAGLRSPLLLYALPATVLLLCLGLPGLAAAQSKDDPPEEEEARQLDTLEVTGTRLRRASLEGPLPVDRYEREEIERMGANSLGEFFRYLPQALDPVSETAQLSSFAGSAGINLRGIGIDNTLTLLNGKRVSAYARNGVSEPFVDITAIPVNAIDRVEILKDGASAIYGADAVAGVVNVILREGFNGLTVGGGALVASEGDGEEYAADLTWGWANADTSLLATLSFFDQSPILARDRGRLNDVDFRDQGGPNLRAFNGTPTTYFRFDTFQAQPDPECGIDPRISNVQSFPFFGEVCLFNFSWFQQLTNETERLAGSFGLRHEFSPALGASVDLFLSRRDTINQGAPTPVLGAFVPADHPDNFLGVPLEHFARPLDTGNRLFDTRAETFHFVAGLEGFRANWEWSADVLLTGNEAETRRRNAVLEDRYALALLGFGGPSGNQYYNPFGASPQNDPSLVDWLTTESRYGATTRESAIEAEARTYFGNLPGGPVGLAIGAQVRRQDLDEFADEIERSGRLAGGSRITQIDADRDIVAAFAEFSLPLHPTLEAQAAIRFDDYSDFGNTLNPKIALAWRPNNDWLVRASHSTSFRPPTFTELFNPRVENVGFYVDAERCAATGAPEDCSQSEYPVFDVGNPDLEPEEGESSYIGAVWSPEAVLGLDLELAYWRFEHTDRIIRLDPQLILDAFGDDGVQRAAPTSEEQALGIPGRIEALTRTFRNSDKLETSGLDLAARYRFGVSRAGRFTLSTQYTYIDEYVLNEALIGSAESGINYAGDYFNREFPIPAHRANLNVLWQRGDHSASAILHYVDGFKDALNLHENNVPTDLPHRVPSHTTLDFQYAVFINAGRTHLRLGCRNCLDREPPVTFGFNGEGIFDYRGALLYARLEHRFR